MDRTLVILLSFLFLAICLAACAKQQGTSKPSKDGKTYLVIDKSAGVEKGKFCSLDGQVWPYEADQPGEIKPGDHVLECTQSTKFKVEPGTEYHIERLGQ